jgi:phage shock protein PspC (stress-responsive transcriptional regulator)
MKSDLSEERCQTAYRKCYVTRGIKMDFGNLPKSEKNILAGVAGGIAEYQGINPYKFRIAFLLTGLLTGGIAVIVYTGLALWMPPPN